MDDSFTLLWITALHVGWTSAPLLAGVLLAARRGVRDVATLLIVGLLTTGVAAFGAFGAFYAAPTLGRVYSYTLFVGSIAVISWCAPTVLRRADLLRRLATPFALWTLGVFFLVFLGFLYGGTENPLQTGAQRFSHPLPSDSFLPYDFGQWYDTHGHNETPPKISGWSVSDRSPLQMGYALDERVYRWTEPALHYQIMGVALQQLWIIGLWALLEAVPIRASIRALVAIAALLSDVAIIHGFYVWPKMLATAFLLAAAALLLTPRWRAARHQPITAVLVAGLFGLAILAHGTSIFGIVGLALVALVRGVPSWRWIVAGALTGVVVLLPWSLFQHHVDPPGNRLAKEAFADVKTEDRRSTAAAVVDAYQDAGIGGVVENKYRNFVTMTVGDEGNNYKDFGDAATFATSGDFEEAIREVRGVRFFSFMFAAGLFALAPFVMLFARFRVRPESKEWRFGVTCLTCAAIGCILWAFLLFGPSQTVVHQGSLALYVLAITGCIAGVASVFRRFAVVLVAANSALVLALYVPLLDAPPGANPSPAAAAGAAASLVAFVVVASWPLLDGLRGRARSHTEAARAPVGGTSPSGNSVT